MSYTANDVIEETLRLLLSGQRETMNKLASSVGANATSLTFTYELGAMAEDSIVGVDTEVYRVWSVDAGNRSVTVEPGMQGSTSAAHSAGALVYVNPRFTRASAFKALNDEIAALSSPSNGLYAVAQTEFTYNSAVTDYNLALSSDVLNVLNVRIKVPGPEDHWITLHDWMLRRKSDTSDFASGNALFIPNGWPNQTIQVVYSKPFDLLTSATQDIETTAGIPRSAQDILAMGVLLRLGSVREIKRNFTEAQGDTRRAVEVPPAATQNSFSALRVLHKQRIDEEAARLIRAYPPRKR